MRQRERKRKVNDYACRRIEGVRGQTCPFPESVRKENVGGGGGG